MSEVGRSGWSAEKEKICLELIAVEVGWWYSEARYIVLSTLYRFEVFKKLLPWEE